MKHVFISIYQYCVYSQSGGFMFASYCVSNSRYKSSHPWCSPPAATVDAHWSFSHTCQIVSGRDTQIAPDASISVWVCAENAFVLMLHRPHTAQVFRNILVTWPRLTKVLVHSIPVWTSGWPTAFRFGWQCAEQTWWHCKVTESLTVSSSSENTHSGTAHGTVEVNRRLTEAFVSTTRDPLI